jgi:S-adenosylmethionine-diacylglycerol 3-amino-3-carboxypropyl transferase
MPASLYGLGIPPAQYEALVRAGNGDIMETLRARTEKLAIGFDPADNYFAWQAFLRRYDTENRRAVPPYLKPEAFETIRSNADKATIHHMNIIDFLKSLPDEDRNAYLFLDAQDWMSREVLTALWEEVTRTAQSGARVVFRTAYFESPLESALPEDILSQWTYDRSLSKTVTDADRSAIYGAAHVYIKR